MAEHNLLGNKGEMLASRYLLDKGFAVLHYNWRSGHKEIDLIARERDMLVFVEVKLRKSADFAAAREYVNRPKQDRIRVTASVYLAAHPTKLQPRFDVIEIYCPQGCNTEKPEIHHLEAAFE